MPLAAVMTAPNQPVELRQLPAPVLEKGGIVQSTLYSIANDELIDDGEG